MQGIGGNDATFGAPRTLKALENVRTVQVACGALFSMAVTAAGELFTWGWGGGGALGARPFPNSSTSDCAWRRLLPECGRRGALRW